MHTKSLPMGVRDQSNSETKIVKHLYTSLFETVGEMLYTSLLDGLQQMHMHNKKIHNS